MRRSANDLRDRPECAAPAPPGVGRTPPVGWIDAPAGAAEILRMTLATPRSLFALAAAALLGVAATPALAADRTETLLKDLSEAPAPSGFEEPVRAIMVRELKPYAKISYDGMGSVIAQNGSAGPRIMLDAHMDELGGMVRRVTPDGFVTIQMLGGWLDMALPGQRWVILTAKGPVKAVSGIRDIHVVPADERT